MLANSRTRRLVEAIPDFNSSVQLLGAVGSEEGATDIAVKHGGFVTDENVESHDGSQYVVRHGRLADKEAMELLQVDLGDLLDLESEGARRATRGHPLRGLILGQDEL